MKYELGNLRSDNSKQHFMLQVIRCLIIFLFLVFHINCLDFIRFTILYEFHDMFYIHFCFFFVNHIYLKQSTFAWITYYNLESYQQCGLTGSYKYEKICTSSTCCKVSLKRNGGCAATATSPSSLSTETARAQIQCLFGGWSGCTATALKLHVFHIMSQLVPDNQYKIWHT